ncbi:MAG: uroporphyrinogen decarboxylase [Rhizomicrobium sp.]
MKSRKNLFAVFERETLIPPPLWMMRQAGRYLPEYRETRAQAGSFWKLCMSPKLASEVTLQPIRRFGFDAAIVFSDILVVPAALGLAVEFETGTGPKITAISNANALKDRVEENLSALEPVYETLGIVRATLDSSTSLLGFAGAPWTLATYIAAGGGGDEQKAAKLWAYRDPIGFQELIDRLGVCVAEHLIRQLKAGADAVQIFDSWASGLTEQAFGQWVVAPTKKIVATIRAAMPQARIIGFPRATTLNGYEHYARDTGVDAISLDTSVPMTWAAKVLGPQIACQGNLDPMALVAGGRALAEGVDVILAAMRDVPFIFNLGHGILPETPIAHVEDMVRRVRSGA